MTIHYLNQWWLVYRRIYASLDLNELTDRKQFVTYNGVASWIEIITCGVPQGSILSSLLFFIVYQRYIYNICSLSVPILYADNTNLFYKGKDINKLLPLLYYQEYRDSCFLHKCLHGFHNTDVYHYLQMTATTQRRTRSTVDDFKISINSARTEKAMEYFFYRAVKPWNMIPYHFRSTRCSNSEIVPFKVGSRSITCILTLTYHDADSVCT